jgi:hypothetical protein
VEKLEGENMARDKLAYAIGNSSSTTLSGSVANDDTTMTITSDTNFAAKEGEGMVLIDEGTATEEFAYSTGKTGTTLTTPLANRGLEGGEAKAHDANATVKGIITATMWNDVIDSLANVVSKTTGALDTTKTVDLTTAQTLTNKTIGTTNLISFNAPEGFLINGKIVPSVADNNLTVALKGLDGNDPSATNPIYVRIGDTVRAITAALSAVSNAGTNYLEMGSAELAAKEVDLFVSLCWNTAGTTPLLLVTRVLRGIYGEYVGNNTAAKGRIVGGTTTGVDAYDRCNVIGRFAATLSAGAGYTWAVPTYTHENLIQRPIYRTRRRSYVPTVSGLTGSIGTFTANPYIGEYTVVEDRVEFQVRIKITNVGSWSSVFKIKLPFDPVAGYMNHTQGFIGPTGVNPATDARGLPMIETQNGWNLYFENNINTAALNWGTHVVANDYIYVTGDYPIA